jgi:hypothetical protein
MGDERYVIEMGRVLPRAVDCVALDGLFVIKVVGRDLYELRFIDEVTSTIFALRTASLSSDYACLRLAERAGKVADLLRGIV